MKQVTLTVVEASGIQEYIFGSNNLRQNVGASELVTRATTEWVVGALDELKVRHNAAWPAGVGWPRLEDVSISSPGQQAEVVYAGGGNALLLFEGTPEGLAHAFTRALTRRAFAQARGLSLVVEHLSFDWEAEALAGQHAQARRKMAVRKAGWLPSAPLTGLGVTAACDFTGQPVVGRDGDGRLVAPVVRHKLSGFALATERLEKIMPEPGARRYQFVQDFDLFGERGHSSYIAVVHVDGNRMGERFMAIADQFTQAEGNADYARRLRRLSTAIQERSVAALRQTIEALMASRQDVVVDNRTMSLFGGRVPVPVRDGQEHLPFRPIVFGGDDTTFVCEGRLGLALAALYLRHLGDQPLPGASEDEPGEPLFARAGVAIVQSHYPFSRAYELAEALCRSAKQRLPDLTPRDARKGHRGTVLDWHVSTSGAILSLDDLRAREYTTDDGQSLLMRPIRVDLTDQAPIGSRFWRSWKVFDETVRAFQTQEEWAGRRNKLKALRGALRRGPKAVEQFRLNYGQPLLPAIPEQSQMPQTGWNGGECGYFDALEALDFYVPLQEALA